MRALFKLVSVVAIAGAMAGFAFGAFTLMIWIS